jgi:uncharacterized membrane protein YfcA
MNELLVMMVIFLAIFTQSLTGFGLALVSMPLLTEALGVHVAAPLVALIAITAEVFLLMRYRSKLNWQAVWRLMVASSIGIPLGVLIVRRMDERTVLTLLGLIVVSYSLYALFDLRQPQIRHPRWAYGFGFIAGLLSGAYNTPGPLVVIYGSCRQWPPAEFKSNLQGFFMLNSAMVIVAHAVSRNFTPVVWQHYLFGIPAIGLGLLAGFSLDQYLDPSRFRKLVLILLIMLGLRLIF